MADDSLRPIHLIQAGDVVVAYDTNTGVWTNRTVLDQWSAVDNGHMTTIELADGSMSTATDHHPYWVESSQQWVDAIELQPGDVLLTVDGALPIVDVTTATRAQTVVWELDVAIDDNFTVHTGTTEVLVHNKNNEEFTLPGGWTGRLDDFNTAGGAEFEIHVFDKNGKEVGFFGSNGWFDKHGLSGPPKNMPPELYNALKGHAIDFMRRSGRLPPKGSPGSDISGDKWKRPRLGKKPC